VAGGAGGGQGPCAGRTGVVAALASHQSEQLLALPAHTHTITDHTLLLTAKAQPISHLHKGKQPHTQRALIKARAHAGTALLVAAVAALQNEGGEAGLAGIDAGARAGQARTVAAVVVWGEGEGGLAGCAVGPGCARAGEALFVAAVAGGQVQGRCAAVAVAFR
jgi:hypothetical protein